MRHLSIRSSGTVVAIAALLASLIAAPAMAHTERDAGPYKIEFGWLHEPTYSGIENAVQVVVHDAKNAPVDDLGAKGLAVQVSAGGQTSGPLGLVGQFDPATGEGTHGEFDAAIIPTTPGIYTFHITGDIKGTAVDISAASSDKTFEDVKDPLGIEFPAKPQTNQQLTVAVTELQNRLSATRAAADAAQSSAGAAKSSARSLALIGIVIAVVSALIAVAALAASRRKTPSAA